MAQVVKLLPSKHKALSSSHSTKKEKEKKTEEDTACWAASL
jgi:hypothetical protein